MYKRIFSNRWMAVAWAAVMLAGVSQYFSDGGGQEQIDAAADQLRGQREEIADLSKPTRHVVEFDAEDDIPWDDPESVPEEDSSDDRIEEAESFADDEALQEGPANYDEPTEGVDDPSFGEPSDAEPI